VKKRGNEKRGEKEREVGTTKNERKKEGKKREKSNHPSKNSGYIRP